MALKKKLLTIRLIDFSRATTATREQWIIFKTLRENYYQPKLNRTKIIFQNLKTFSNKT